jgi:hypothetical protein
MGYPVSRRAQHQYSGTSRHGAVEKDSASQTLGNTIQFQKTKMSHSNLGVIEIQERKFVSPTAGKGKRQFSFLAGAGVLIALAAIGIALRSSRTQPIQPDANKAGEMAVTVVHPERASITIPVLPGQTQSLY